MLFFRCHSALFSLLRLRWLRFHRVPIPGGSYNYRATGVVDTAILLIVLLLYCINSAVVVLLLPSLIIFIAVGVLLLLFVTVFTLVLRGFFPRALRTTPRMCEEGIKSSSTDRRWEVEYTLHKGDLPPHRCI